VLKRKLTEEDARARSTLRGSQRLKETRMRSRLSLRVGNWRFVKLTRVRFKKREVSSMVEPS
jgi:hypothetical protein